MKKKNLFVITENALEADAQVQPELLSVLLWSCFSITAHRENVSCQQLFRGNYWLQRASSLLGCTGKSIASRSVEVIFLCSALGRHAWSVWCWAPQSSSGMDIVEKGQQRDINMTEVLEHLSYEEKQQSLDHSAWRREGSGESYPCVLLLMQGIEHMEPGFSQWCLVVGQEALITTWSTGNSI